MARLSMFFFCVLPTRQAKSEVSINRNSVKLQQNVQAGFELTITYI